MAQNHVQKGASMPWTNATSADVASGDVVVVGDIIGVAAGDIADGAEGILFIEEVWLLPKAAPLVISQGDKVYFDATAGNVNKTDTDALAGVCFEGAVSAATTVKVKINAASVSTVAAGE